MSLGRDGYGKMASSRPTPRVQYGLHHPPLWSHRRTSELQYAKGLPHASK